MHSPQALLESTLVIVDIETTGFSPQSSALTEIGAVKLVNGTVVEEFQTFVDPEQPIPSFISSMTGISDDDVFGAPSQLEAVQNFLDFAGLNSTFETDPILVAHNAAFDLGFLRYICNNNASQWPALAYIDTLYLSRNVFRHERPAPENFKLDTLASHFNVPVKPSHRALADAQATVSILLNLFDLHQKHNLGAVRVFEHSAT